MSVCLGHYKSLVTILYLNERLGHGVIYLHYIYIACTCISLQVADSLEGQATLDSEGPKATKHFNEKGRII